MSDAIGADAIGAVFDDGAFADCRQTRRASDRIAKAWSKGLAKWGSRVLLQNRVGGEGYVWAKLIHVRNVDVAGDIVITDKTLMFTPVDAQLAQFALPPKQNDRLFQYPDNSSLEAGYRFLNDAASYDIADTPVLYRAFVRGGN